MQIMLHKGQHLVEFIALHRCYDTYFY